MKEVMIEILCFSRSLFYDESGFLRQAFETVFMKKQTIIK
jgi:hypothetical protein